MIKEQLRKIVEESIKKIYPEIEIDFEIEYPPRKEMGDYSTQVALKLAKKIKQKPAEIAQKIAENLPANNLIEKAAEQAGFLNFWLKSDFLANEINQILNQKSDYGHSDLGQGKKLQVEFISANPTGPLTLGNARGGFLGDCLSNILSFADYDVWREYYVNDCGKQIEALGKSVLGIEKIYQGEYIEQLKSRVKSKDPVKAGQEAAKIIKEEIIEADVGKMGIGFDQWFWESSLILDGSVEKAIDELKKKKLVYEKEGALWFKTSQFSDDKDRVLVKKDGSYTYFATDIANHLNKFDRGFEQVIDIWGADHHGDVPRIKAAAKVFGFDKKLEIILHQFVRILEGGEPVRMSKRSGRYILIRDLIDEVGLDVVRFFFLMYDANTHIDFDLKLAREHSEKNPVYYIQYMSARINGILEKIKMQKSILRLRSGLMVSEVEPSKIKMKMKNLEFSEKAEIDLVKELIKFPDLIAEITQDKQVQKLPQYLTSLARTFHNFYDCCRVISDDQVIDQNRLALVAASQIVLKNGLELLEIRAPERM